MTNDGKIYIVITDKMPTGSKNQISSSSQVQESNDNAILQHWARDNIINTTKSLIKRTATYQLSNIGNFTGDYLTQNQVNNTLSNLQTLSSIGMGAYSGFVATGGSPIGAVIGLSLSLLNASVNSVFNIHSQRVQNQKTNYEIAQLRDRAGLNSLRDGSRGTEN